MWTTFIVIIIAIVTTIIFTGKRLLRWNEIAKEEALHYENE